MEVCYDMELTDRDWEVAQDAHSRLVGLLESSPRAKEAFDRLLAEIQERQVSLRKVREARALTQSTIAELLDMDQSEVSRLEHRSDVLLSTLRRFIEATGGELHLVATYPDSVPVELRLAEPGGATAEPDRHRRRAG